MQVCALICSCVPSASVSVKHSRSLLTRPCNTVEPTSLTSILKKTLQALDAILHQPSPLFLSPIFPVCSLSPDGTLVLKSRKHASGFHAQSRTQNSPEQTSPAEAIMNVRTEESPVVLCLLGLLGEAGVLPLFSLGSSCPVSNLRLRRVGDATSACPVLSSVCAMLPQLNLDRGLCKEGRIKTGQATDTSVQTAAVGISPAAAPTAQTGVGDGLRDAVQECLDPDVTEERARAAHARAGNLLKILHPVSLRTSVEEVRFGRLLCSSCCDACAHTYKHTFYVRV